MKEKTVIVHGIVEARAALAAAESFGRPLVLASAPGAAGYAGVPWFAALLRQARAEYPGTRVSGLLDCGDKPGLVLAALDQDIERLRFTGPAKVRSKLAALCETRGVALLSGSLKALDLGCEADPEAACRAWLARP